MKIKCDYCGADMNDYDEICISCGAKNKHLLKRKNGVPSTIEELDIWFKDQNFMPDNGTVYIFGKDYRGPNAYGIYKDVQTENYIVYRNSQNMKREIIYEGNDEAYAVNELYMKIKETIILRRNYKKRVQENIENDDIPVEKIKEIIKTSRLAKVIFVVSIIIIVLSIIF